MTGQFGNPSSLTGPTTTPPTPNSPPPHKYFQSSLQVGEVVRRGPHWNTRLNRNEDTKLMPDGTEECHEGIIKSKKIENGIDLYEVDWIVPGPSGPVTFSTSTKIEYSSNSMNFSLFCVDPNDSEVFPGNKKHFCSVLSNIWFGSSGHQVPAATTRTPEQAESDRRNELKYLFNYMPAFLDFVCSMSKKFPDYSKNIFSR